MVRLNFVFGKFIGRPGPIRPVPARRILWCVSTVATPTSEYRTITEAWGLLDRSERGKLALTGAGAKEFLNGQVTNEVETLQPGEGCYAAANFWDRPCWDERTTSRRSYSDPLCSRFPHRRFGILR